MSHTKKYISIYGALKPIRPDQFLVELIIKRRADKKKITLPNRFWSVKGVQYQYWTRLFYSECRHAKPLFDKYDPECVIDAFLSHDCQYVLSSANKQLEKITQEFQRRKDVIEQTKIVVTVTSVDTSSKPRKPLGKLNKLSKLRNE